MSAEWTRRSMSLGSRSMPFKSLSKQWRMPINDEIQSVLLFVWRLSLWRCLSVRKTCRSIVCEQKSFTSSGSCSILISWHWIYFSFINGSISLYLIDCCICMLATQHRRSFSSNSIPIRKVRFIWFPFKSRWTQSMVPLKSIDVLMFDHYFRSTQKSLHFNIISHVSIIPLFYVSSIQPISVFVMKIIADQNVFPTIIISINVRRVFPVDNVWKKIRGNRILFVYAHDVIMEVYVNIISKEWVLPWIPCSIRSIVQFKLFISYLHWWFFSSVE